MPSGRWLVTSKLVYQAGQRIPEGRYGKPSTTKCCTQLHPRHTLSHVLDHGKDAVILPILKNDGRVLQTLTKCPIQRKVIVGVVSLSINLAYDISRLCRAGLQGVSDVGLTCSRGGAYDPNQAAASRHVTI
jgi:hypothetical protein